MPDQPLDLGHSGPSDDALHRPTTDRRVTNLAEESQQLPPLQQIGRFLSDSFSVFGRFNQALSSDVLHLGKVVQVMPGTQWYHVQLDRGAPPISACLMSSTGFVPPAIVSGSVIPPNSDVVVWKPKARSFGIILGAVPFLRRDGTRGIATILQQGGNSGFKREQAYLRILKSLFRGGGVKDWSCHRPLDGTTMEWSQVSATNIAVLIDNFQAFLRVNETCGLFLNYFDSYTRLAGLNLDIQTPPWCLTTRDDEGEHQTTIEHFTYPWEAVGRYDRGEWAQTLTDKEVQYDKAKGKIDLADEDNDLQAFARLTEYGGYLGQGFLKVLVAPPTDNGKRKYSQTEPDIGLFTESLGLDGSYLLQSAKQIALVKRVLIPSPKRLRLPEDQKTGDDSREGNYKASGTFGGGVDHKVGDVQVSGDTTELLRPAGVLDLLAYACNWKGLHPFHYHALDFEVPEQSEITKFQAVQDELDFSVGKNQPFLDPPEAKQVKVDARYGDVDYFQRESFLVQHDDGSVTFGCGYGNQIRMGADGISFESPIDINFHAGRRATFWTGQFICKAKGSIDFSSSEKDVRVKAKRNLQLLSKGGILLESQAPATTQAYDGKYGEDVESSGIVLLAKQSQIGTLAQDILLRTGGDKLGSGAITFDVDRGKQALNITAKQANLFLTSELGVWFADSPDNFKAQANCRFGQSQSRISGFCTFEKGGYVGGSLMLKEGLQAKGSIVTLGSLAHKGEKQFPGDSTTIKQTVEDALQRLDANQDEQLTAGDKLWESEISKKWLESNKLGDSKLHEKIGFSFRDPLSGSQYLTDNFKLLEPRWQQMVRLQLATGGEAWKEDPVEYQGRQTYPFPGKQALTGNSGFLRYKEYKLFDASQRLDRTRGEAYEEPQLSEFQPAAIDGEYKLI